MASFTLSSQDRRMVTLVTRNAGEVRERIAADVIDFAIHDLAADLRARSVELGISRLDLDAFAHAGVALANEFGYRLIQQRPVDIEGTTEFVTERLLGGMERMAGRRL